MALVRRQEARPRPAGGWQLANAAPLANVFQEFDQLFDGLATPLYSHAQWAQGYPVDLYETGDEVVLEMAVPGIRVGDLDISLEGRQLSVRGALPEAEATSRRYWLQSIPHGEFQRTVTLPIAVQADAVEATVADGLLTLRMPKVAEARARKIAIQTG